MSQESALRTCEKVLLDVVAERERYRAALEQIAGHFIDQPDGTVKTYAGPMGTLDLIRREATEALGR